MALRLRRWGGLFLACALAVPAMAETSSRVALLVGPTQDKYIGAVAAAFTAAADSGGLTVTVFSTPFDPALQAQQIDDAVAQKFDLLVIQTVSQKAIVPPLTRAKSAGIPVMSIIVPLSDDAQALAVAYVGSDQTKLGALAGEAMGQALAASGRTGAKVAAITGAMDEGIGPMRMAGFKAALAKFPGLELVATEDAKWNPVNAEREAGQLLARYAAQGGLDGIYGMNDLLANAAIVSAQSASMKVGSGPGALVVIGGNCQAPGIRNLASGKMAATVLLLPAEEGTAAATVAKAILAHADVSRDTYVRADTITRANLAAYEKACSY